MDLSVFTTILTSAKTYLEAAVRKALWVPIAAFFGALSLVYVGTFGLQAPLAFWRQLPGELRVLLAAVAAFAVLFLAYLASRFTVVVTRLYQGYWPGWLKALTLYKRTAHYDKWRKLGRQFWQLSRRVDSIKALHERFWKGAQEAEEASVPRRPLPRWHVIAEGDLVEREFSELELLGCYGLKSDLLGKYTLDALDEGTPVKETSVREKPSWYGLAGSSVIPLPLSWDATVGAKSHVQPGNVIEVVLTPKPGRRARSEDPIPCMVLALDFTEEPIGDCSEGKRTRQVAVLTVAMERTKAIEVAGLLATHDVAVTRLIETAAATHDESRAGNASQSSEPRGPTASLNDGPRPATNSTPGNPGTAFDLLKERLEDLRSRTQEWITAPFDLDDTRWQTYRADLERLAEDVLHHMPATMTDEYKHIWTVGPDSVKELVEELRDALDDHADSLLRHINLYYPIDKPEQMMPTELGNIVKAVETYPWENYRIWAAAVWPRLRAELDAETKEAVSAGEDAMDMLLLMSLLSLVFWPLGSATLALFSEKWWAFLLCAIGAPLVAWMCYRASIQFALQWGENVKAAYDLHRSELLKKFNLDLPEKMTLRTERETWLKINELLVGRPTDEGFMKLKYSTGTEK